MASICGAILALMDAGVPITSPVSGVAMGMVKEGDKYAILTDIAGAEDHYGDMDFKVAGTRDGITGMQMDIKVPNITTGIMKEAMEQARRGRLYILDKMHEAIAEPRAEMSLYAPRIYTVMIPTDKIREVIGPGGKVIRGIIEQTGVKIDVEDDGTVHVASADEASARKALQIITDITATAEIGKTYLGKVVRLVDFGAEKCPSYADIPLSRNPSLGLRGIRLLLQREDILQPQVRAIARLARERAVTLLLPMLDTLDTLEATIDGLCRAVGCATKAQFPFRLGAMIEVPAAALQAEEILPNVDSISIGLNDLTQYLLAADRDDEFVERYHDAMQPSVLRLLSQIVGAASAQGKPLTICGEMAGDPKLTGLLLALGIRRLSVARSNYRGVVNAVRRLSLRSMEGIGAEVLGLGTGAAVRKYVADRLTASPTGAEG
jgi:hypothetical protein